jgi:hypothetical protein
LGPIPNPQSPIPKKTTHFRKKKKQNLFNQLIIN